MDGVTLVEGDKVPSRETTFREGKGDPICGKCSLVCHVDELGHERKFIYMDLT